MLPSMIPKEGTILGGNMTLKGRNLTLACFHGMNFKAKSWALFTMHEPYIIFSTESQQLPEGGRADLCLLPLIPLLQEYFILSTLTFVWYFTILILIHTVDLSRSGVKVTGIL